MKISFTRAEKEALIGAFYRYFVGIGAAVFFWTFRKTLPFPFPHLAVLSLMTPAYNTLVIIGLLLHKYPKITHTAPIYIDAVLMSAGFYLSGGFMSPFLVIGLVTMFGSGIIYTERRNLGTHIFSIFISSYAFVSIGTKLGILPALTPYEQNLLSNTPFFLLIFTVVFSAYVMGYIIMRLFSKNVHTTLADVFYAHQKIVESAAREHQAAGGLGHLVEHLGRALHAQYACAVECVNDGASVREVAAWSLERIESAGLEQRIAGSPFETVMNESTAIWNGDLKASFPECEIVSAFNMRSFRGRVLRDADRKPVGAICVMNKGALPPAPHGESILAVFAARAGAELLRLQADRDRQRMQEELLQAQKMEAVGHLASGIAHDFNNMLGAILGFSELLWRKLDRESPLRGYADRITVIARRGSELTKQMLAFARKGKYRNVPVDIHGLLSEIIFMLEHTLGKRIKIRLTRDALYSTTQGDPSQLQNMIINLAINARDAMPEGGVLTVATETVHIDNPADVRPFGGFEVKKGDYCVLHIEDSGTGIPPENLPHIFEPFFTSRPRGRGTGLGLASVYGCVKNHHGFIVVDNRVGEGVAFRIHLPLVSTPRRPPTRSIKVHNLDQRRIAHVRIQAMLVDDEQDVLDGLCDGLRALGWTVHPFKSGDDAVAFYRQRYTDIDVVVLDMVMPGMSGREVFAALKEIDDDLIAILASGYARGNDAEELLGAGAADYLEKPFSASDLALSAEKALLERWQGDSPS